MTDLSLTASFLVGKDEISEQLKKIKQEMSVSNIPSIFGKVLDKDFNKAKGRVKDLKQIFQELDISTLSSVKSQPKNELPSPDKLLKGLMESSNLINSIFKQAQDLGTMNALGVNTDKAISDLKMLGKQCNVTEKQIDDMFSRGVRKANEFDMRLLSAMFLAMSLDRVFTGMMRSLTNTYAKAEDETSGLSMKTQELGAAWEFFKFSLLDALNTPFFLNMIDGLISVINWFSQMDSSSKIVILSIIGGLIVLTKTIFWLSQFSLGWGSIMAEGGFATTITEIGADLGMTGVLGWLLAIVVGVVVLYAVWETNFGKIQDITAETMELLETGFSNAWKGIKESASGIWNTLRGLFTGNYDLFVNGLGLLGVGILRFGGNIGTMFNILLLNLIRFIIDGAVDLVQGMINIIGESVIRFVEWVNEKLGTSFDTEGARKQLTKLSNAIEEYQTKSGFFDSLAEKQKEALSQSNSLFDEWSEGFKSKIKEVNELSKEVEPVQFSFLDYGQGKTQGMSIYTPEVEQGFSSYKQQITDTELDFVGLVNKSKSELSTMFSSFTELGTGISTVTNDTINPSLASTGNEITKNQQLLDNMTAELDKLNGSVTRHTIEITTVHKTVNA